MPLKPGPDFQYATGASVLRICTDGVCDTGRELEVNFRMWDKQRDFMTDMRWHYYEDERQWRGYVWQCKPGYNLAFTSVPDTDEKIWEFKKVDETIRILCNGISVFSYNLSDPKVSVCSNESWIKEPLGFVTFLEHDGATDRINVGLCKLSLLLLVLGRKVVTGRKVAPKFDT